MENNTDIEQNIKGNDNVQQQIIVNGDFNLGLNKEQVLDMIKSYCFTDKEQIIEIVQESINNIPADKRETPNKRIFVPIIQQLSYSLDDEIIKQTYQKLLHSSMHKDKSKITHPSFINIISQLNSDEIKILNSLPMSLGIPIPLIDLRMKIDKQAGLGSTLVTNFSDIGYGICDNPGQICSYIQNLERLKLIEIPNGKIILEDKFYDSLRNHEEITKVIASNTAPKNVTITYEFDKKYYQLTTFGQLFLKCCIE